MILCVGEILADMIGSERDGNFYYERKAGGAPFNVACAAQRFGAEVAFVGCVGDDLIGAFLKQFAEDRGFSHTEIATDPARNTTLAFVELDEHGDRSFCFYRHGTADYHLPSVPDAYLRRATLVHIGSLMLSTEEGRAYALLLADRAHRAGIPVSFDVNFRTDIFRDKDAALAVYRQMLEKADIVKFSEDEVEMFTEDYIRDRLKEKLVFVTLGKHGAEWRYHGKTHHLPALDLKPVDTTGAGDAFYAGVLSRLDGKRTDDLSDAQLDEALKWGNVAGSLNTLGHGAIDCLPTQEEILRALETY